MSGEHARQGLLTSQPVLVHHNDCTMSKVFLLESLAILGALVSHDASLCLTVDVECLDVELGLFRCTSNEGCVEESRRSCGRGISEVPLIHLRSPAGSQHFIS